jgi:hypothetical protein
MCVTECVGGDKPWGADTTPREGPLSLVRDARSEYSIRTGFSR